MDRHTVYTLELLNIVKSIRDADLDAKYQEQYRQRGREFLSSLINLYDFLDHKGDINARGIDILSNHSKIIREAYPEMYAAQFKERISDYRRRFDDGKDLEEVAEFFYKIAEQHEAHIPRGYCW